MRPTLEKVLSPAMIRDVSCLGILLLRLPLMNPTLEVLRSVASCIILTRLMKWTYFLQQTPLLHDKECLVVASIVTLLCITLIFDPVMWSFRCVVSSVMQRRFFRVFDNFPKYLPFQPSLLPYAGNFVNT